jgi:hypothetical protein
VVVLAQSGPSAASHRSFDDGDGAEGLPSSDDGRWVGVTGGGAEWVAEGDVAGGVAGVWVHGRVPPLATRTTPVEPVAAQTIASFAIRPFARRDGLRGSVTAAARNADAAAPSSVSSSTWAGAVAARSTAVSRVCEVAG